MFYESKIQSPLGWMEMQKGCKLMEKDKNAGDLHPGQDLLKFHMQME